MTSLKELVVAGYGVKIGVRKGLLTIIDKDGNKTEYAVRSLETIVIASSGVSITSHAVRVLMDAGVDIVFLDSHGLPIGRVYPPFINRTVDTRIKQYSLHDTEYGIGIAKTIVYCKIANQAGHMKHYARRLASELFRETYYEILEILRELEEIQPYNLETFRREAIELEARAAHKYWSAIATLIPPDIGFTGRNQAGSDSFNISLNYLYGVLYKVIWRALVLAGLDPYLGYIHVERSGRPVLVYDFIEMFRVSCVDYPLTKAFYKGWKPSIEDKRIDYSSRVELIKLFKENMSRRISYNHGEKGVLGNILKKTAFRLAESIREYKPFNGFIEDW